MAHTKTNNRGSKVQKTDQETDDHVSKHTDVHALETDDIHFGQDVGNSFTGANSVVHYFHPQQNIY